MHPKALCAIKVAKFATGSTPSHLLLYLSISQKMVTLSYTPTPLLVYISIASIVAVVIHLLLRKNRREWPISYRLIPQLSVLRKAVQDARQLTDAEVAKQEPVVDEALRASERPPKLVNTLRWMYELAKARKGGLHGSPNWPLQFFESPCCHLLMDCFMKSLARYMGKGVSANTCVC